MTRRWKICNIVDLFCHMWDSNNIKSKMRLAEIQGVNILNTKGQMDTACVRDIYRMTWTMAICHEERKKSR